MPFIPPEFRYLSPGDFIIAKEDYSTYMKAGERYEFVKHGVSSYAAGVCCKPASSFVMPYKYICVDQEINSNQEAAFLLRRD